MNLLIRCSLFVLVSCFVQGEVILTEDKPYDVIKFNVPLNIWKKAIQPTPILKSSATIVLPVHVSEEYLGNEDIEENDTVDEQNEVVNQEVVNDETVGADPVIQSDIVVQNETVAAVTETIIQDEEVSQPPDEQVPGQVFRFPCSCVRGQCGCCTGMILQRLRMNACGNISFVPEDFVFDVRMTVNNNTVLRRRVSASDPPPICFNPRRAPFIRVCAEITNIRIRNRNAFACLDINADIGGFQVYSASFRCFGLGSSGVQTGLKPKPVSSGPAPVNLFGSNTNNEGESFVQNAAGVILSESAGGLIDGVADNIFGGDSDNDGPLNAIGNAVENLFGA